MENDYPDFLKLYLVIHSMKKRIQNQDNSEIFNESFDYMFLRTESPYYIE